MNPRLDTVQNLIWIQTSFLGDIILQTAALNYVQREHPSIRQYLITTPLGARALAGHPSLYKIVVFDKRGRSMHKAVQSVKSDLRECGREATVLLQAHRSVRSSLLARALGFFSVTYDETRLSFLAHRRVPRVAVLHETQRISLLLEPLGASRDRLFASLPSLTPVATPLVNELKQKVAGQGLIGIAPGSVWGTKRWPVSHFIEMGRLLLERTDHTLLILGSQDEQAAASSMEQGLSTSASRVINLAGRTSLDDLRGLYPQLNLLVSNDSSPLHYASAFQIPTLAIFGATVPGLGFGPLAPQRLIAEVDLECRPCSDHGPQECPLGHFKCMKTLLPERVASMALGLLSAAQV
ncbi:MAG TPA: glycosyltransferase family 9 protein [Oligoflexus sp.]|uniref:glycosyltransferase family 9 protein n=1 Tax=Oligoflexus sp. TaxID=1971216 RepID=UPI002D2A2A49|nr:glycosyltransferase family 9 protein [Oligoflexus sp.]HYX36054.1 glycosyltransferase family 9 protein [Oligoflexus sp.]